jgi:hypothetical protein
MYITGTKIKTVIKNLPAKKSPVNLDGFTTESIRPLKIEHQYSYHYTIKYKWKECYQTHPMKTVLQ